MSFLGTESTPIITMGLHLIKRPTYNVNPRCCRDVGGEKRKVRRRGVVREETTTDVEVVKVRCSREGVTGWGGLEGDGGAAKMENGSGLLAHHSGSVPSLG